MDSYRIALAGNPNAGKTSLFNALTGARQHVGNYPGVTVEKREGHFTFEERRYDVLDLPGTYSLTSFSPEERIAQDSLLEEGLDAVVVVADATNLSRSLMLLVQVMLTRARPVLCLNMADEARAAGQRIDIKNLSSLLGVPVVETVGHRKQGIDELRAAIRAACESEPGRLKLVLGERLDKVLATLAPHLAGTSFPECQHAWIAIKLLMADPTWLDRTSERGEPGKSAIALAEQERKDIESKTGQDIALYVTERFYGFIDGLLREVTLAEPRADARAASDLVDRIVVNRVLGIPIFLAIMYGIFWLTFTVGEIPMGWIESGFELLGRWVSGFWPEGSDSPLRSLIVDGVIGGVGGVVVFLPNIVLLFLGLALLEDSGYMARAAFLVDRLMHRFGLHGKSFIPMVTGFGCSIPGIMVTRTMENERDRLTTILVLPLMSCGARLPIWMLLVPAFFSPGWRAPALWGIYVVGVVFAMVLALLLRKTVLAGDDAPFVMELPPYRTPTARAVVSRMVERSGLYLKKAGTVILGISILMWFITAYPKADTYRVDAQVAAGKVQVVEAAVQDATPAVEAITPEQYEASKAADDLRASVAGRIGTAIEPVLRPLGFDWKIGIAMLGAFAAKEVFVAQLGIVYSMGETDEQSADLRKALQRDYTLLQAISLMLFLLISAPCMATIAVTKRETGHWKWGLFQLGGLTAVAYLVSLAVFQLGRLLT